VLYRLLTQCYHRVNPIDRLILTKLIFLYPCQSIFICSSVLPKAGSSNSFLSLSSGWWRTVVKWSQSTPAFANCLWIALNLLGTLQEVELALVVFSSDSSSPSPSAPHLCGQAWHLGLTTELNWIKLISQIIQHPHAAYDTDKCWLL